jgi:hypothetical protein
MQRWSDSKLIAGNVINIGPPWASRPAWNLDAPDKLAPRCLGWQSVGSFPWEQPLRAFGTMRT